MLPKSYLLLGEKNCEEEVDANICLFIEVKCWDISTVIVRPREMNDRLMLVWACDLSLWSNCVDFSYFGGYFRVLEEDLGLSPKSLDTSLIFSSSWLTDLGWSSTKSNKLQRIPAAAKADAAAALFLESTNSGTCFFHFIALKSWQNLSPKE